MLYDAKYSFKDLFSLKENKKQNFTSIWITPQMATTANIQS